MQTITQHDDAIAAIRYALLGTEIRWTRLQRNAMTMREGSDRWDRSGVAIVELRNLGRETACVPVIYELPCNASELVESARARVNDALIRRGLTRVVQPWEEVS